MNAHFPQVGMNWMYAASHYVTSVLADIAFRGDLAGLEHLPSSGGFLIAANHQSHLDPPIVACRVPLQMNFFARKTLWKPGLPSKWLDAVGCIPVDRDGDSDLQAMKRVLRALGQGKVLVLFPEGTRSPDGKLHKPKAGVGFMACKTGVPVVPARIFGSFEAYSRNGPLRFGTPISLVFGKPLSPAEYDNPKDGKERYQRSSERIFARIAALTLPRAKVL
jgi:1-acyl-sn-glycerol-3-phosphate acyltransferase